MKAAEQGTRAVKTHSLYIKATTATIWDAITKADWTKQYGCAPLVEYQPWPRRSFRMYADEGMMVLGMPDVIADGEVIEVKPPFKLVQTWRMLMDRSLTYEIEE